MAPCMHTCDVHTANTSTARMKSKRASGAALPDALLWVNPSPLRPFVHQDGERGGRNALFHPMHPCFPETPTPEDIPEKTPVNRVIGLSEIHLPRKIGGAVSMPCYYDLFCQHDIVCHLPAQNKGKLERAYQR